MKAGFPQLRPSSTLARLSNSAAIWPTRAELKGPVKIPIPRYLQIQTNNNCGCTAAGKK